MRPSTLIGVLLLRRAAILDAFNSRWSLPIGGLLVFSAALARNYDGEDLRAEPWWLAAPFGASILTSLILWGMFSPWAKLREARLWRLYPRFLGVYWLTAPLAWFYAIPYERFLSPVDAVRANAYTLLIVSLWRVLIISRVLSLLFTIRFRAALAFTLMFGALVMLGATFFGPRPVLDVMGGLRLPPEDNYRASLTFATGFFSIIGVVIFGVCAAVYCPRRPTTNGTAATVPEARTDRPPRSPAAALAVALLCILAWIPALQVPQLEQRNRRIAEQLFTRDDYAALLSELSSRTITEYPPGWRVPGSHLDAPSRLELSARILPHLGTDTAAWVRDAYLDIARDSVFYFRAFIPTGDWVADVIEDAAKHGGNVRSPSQQQVLDWLGQNDPTLTDSQRQRLKDFTAPPAQPPAPTAPPP